MSFLAINQGDQILDRGKVEMQVVPLPIGEHIIPDDLLSHKVLRLQRSEVGPFLRRMDTEELEYQDMEMRPLPKHTLQHMQFHGP
jgi:hypothetical protein